RALVAAAARALVAAAARALVAAAARALAAAAVLVASRRPVVPVAWPQEAAPASLPTTTRHIATPSAWLAMAPQQLSRILKREHSRTIATGWTAGPTGARTRALTAMTSALAT